MRTPLIALAVAALAACSEPPKEVRISEALPTVPLPPAARIIGREIGAEAVKVQFRSGLSPEQVATYYRELFSRAPWRLVSDVKMADSSITIYAEQDGPPVWITIRPVAGSEGSFVDLAGAKTR